jgi:hypothetical protein
MPMPSGLKQIPSEHNKEPKSKRSRDILAGFCCGLAIASEYSSGLIVVGLFVWLLATNRHRAFAFAVAALAPLMLIPLYSWACFGSPFVLAYSYQASFPEMQWGIYAIQWPDPVTAWNLLIPPTRGLFFWTPFLLMAGLGYYFIAVKRHGLFLLTYMVPLLHVVVISGRTWDWQAGFAFGPRLLAPMLPLLALPCALGARQWPKLGLTLAAYSILVTTLATLTDANPSTNYYNPLTQMHLPLFLKGEISVNLMTALGMSPFRSVGLYYTVVFLGILCLWERRPNAGN